MDFNFSLRTDEFTFKKRQINSSFLGNGKAEGVVVRPLYNAD